MTILARKLSLFSASIFILGTMIGMSEPVYADRGDGYDRYDQKQSHYNKSHKNHKQKKAHYKQDNGRHNKHNKHYNKHRHDRHYVIPHGHHHRKPAHRGYRYRNVNVVRHYGPVYRGYGGFYLDDDAYPWLAFTAITLKVLDNFNEDQQRAHESAQVRATSAPIGETITWNRGGAAGSVTPVRDGISTSGRYCREFQHVVKIGGRSERAYGTACRQSDGSWEVVSSSSR